MVKKSIHVEIHSKTLCISSWKSPVKICAFLFHFTKYVYKIFYSHIFPYFPTIFFTTLPYLLHKYLFHYSTYTTITTTNIYIFNNRKEFI